MRLKPMSLNGLMNFAMVTGIDVTPNLYYYVAKIRIISQTSIIRQHLFGLLLLAIDKNSNKNLLSAKKESFCDISRNEMNHPVIESSISILFGVSYLILEYQTGGTGVSLSWYCL